MPVVNSRDVAEQFGKLHKHVLRDVDALVNGCPDMGTREWFREVETEIVGGQGAVQRVRSVDLTRDGFTLLVMGWTGRRRDIRNSTRE